MSEAAASLFSREPADPAMPILTQAPDPNPKTPRLICPPGACDSHIHLFGPAQKYPFATDSPYTSRDALPETFIALQNRLGFSRAVIVSPAATAAITASWRIRSRTAASVSAALR
jgi:hypothetical protein